MSDNIVTKGSGLDPTTQLFLRVEKQILDLFIELIPLINYNLAEDSETEIFEIVASLDTLFAVFGMSTKDYKEMLKIVDVVQVLTPTGKWVQIEGLIKKEDKKLRVLFKANNEIIAGAHHLVRTSDGAKHLKIAPDVFNAKSKSFDEVLNVIPLGTNSEVYDIIIPTPHVYITSNFYAHDSGSIISK